MNRTNRLLLILGLALFGALSASAQTITHSTQVPQVGSGLQTSLWRARLSDDTHGGIFVTIAVSDTNLVRVTADEGLPGGETVDVFVPNGSTDANFYLQALEGDTGNADVTSSAPGYGQVVDTIAVVVPGARLLGLQASHDPYALDDAILVSVGVPNGTGTTLSLGQKARVGGPGLTATFTSSAPAVGQLVTTALTGSVVSATIIPGASTSPSSVGTGGVAFDGLAEGVTGITATIPGFATILPDTQFVTVTEPVVTFQSEPWKLGSGLQQTTRKVRLSGSQHGGTTVSLVSADSTALLLAPNATTVGSGTLDFFIADGSIDATFVIQSVEGNFGDVVVTATAPGFTGDVTLVEIEQPVFRLVGLGTSIDTLDPADAFVLSIGLPNTGGTVVGSPQGPRFGGPGVTATVHLDDPLVGQLVTSTLTSDTVSVFFAPGQASSPSSVALGGVAFDGLGLGTTQVSATIPGFAPVTTAFVDVTVTQPGFSFGAFYNRLGAGLRSSKNNAYLQASQHGGVTVRVESLDPGLMLVSAHGDSVGTPFVDVPLANGQTTVDFYTHGVDDTTGTATLAVSSPQFTSTTRTIEVLTPGTRIYGLVTTIDTADPTDSFYVGIGAPNTTLTNIAGQVVRPGSAGFGFDIVAGDPAIGQIVTLTDTTDVLSVVIPAGVSTTATSLATGGPGFDGIAPGTTTVSTVSPRLEPLSVSTRTVTVTAPTLSYSGFTRVGAGLQTEPKIFLSASGHGGVELTIATSDPALALVGTSPTAVGQDTVTVFVPDGSTQVPFVVQGLDGVVAPVDITASAPGFVPLTTNVTVEQPGVEIRSLWTTIDRSDAVDPFYARVGIPTGDNSSVSSGLVQARRGGAAPLAVTFAVSDSTLAQLVTSSDAGPVLDRPIVPDASQTATTVATGGIALDGLDAGEILVTAAIPGFIQTGAAQVVVDVTDQNIVLNGLETRLGAGLQTEVAAELGESGHGGVTMTISVSDTSLALISPNAQTAGGPAFQTAVSNGQTEVTFYLQALEGAAGSPVTVTADVPGFNAGVQVVDLVAPATAIVMLADSMDVNVDDDEFLVQIGAVNADSTGLHELQAIRGGVAPRVISIAVSDPLVGLVADLGGAADTVQLSFAPGELQSPATVAEGGVAFDPLGPGTVIVSAGAPGWVTTTAGAPVLLLTGEVTAVDDVVPMVTNLGRNFPNPFNPRTMIRFDLARRGPVRLQVYDVAGRLVRTLQGGEVLAAGRYEVPWAGRDDRGRGVAAGVYFCRLQADGTVRTQAMTLIK